MFKTKSTEVPDFSKTDFTSLVLKILINRNGYLMNTHSWKMKDNHQTNQYAGEIFNYVKLTNPQIILKIMMNLTTDTFQ